MSNEHTEQPQSGFNPPKTENFMQALVRFLKGTLIGIGAILPGLSGGVLAVIFGVYDPIMRFLSNPFHRLAPNLIYFLPLGLGGGLGVILFAFFVSAALGSYEAFFTCLFIGLVVGTFPSLYREAGKEGRDRKDKMLMLAAAVLVFAVMMAGEQTFTKVEPNTIVWFFCGILVGLGFIVPGLSPSNFLIYFDLYKKMSDALKDFNMSAVLPLMIGAAVCIFGLAKPVKYLLDHRYSRIYHFILGLVIGSSAGIFPTVVFPGMGAEQLRQLHMSLAGAAALCALFFAAGIAASRLFSRLEKYAE